MCCLIQEDETAQEDEIPGQPHCSEATIVYCGGCPPRCGRSRRVPLGGRKVETMALRCPVLRSRLKATKKESVTACGEESTRQGTYTNVSFRNTFEIPLIAPTEKAQTVLCPCRSCQTAGQRRMERTAPCTGRNQNLLPCGVPSWMNGAFRQS